MSVLKAVLMNVATGGFDPVGAAFRGARGRRLEAKARKQQELENTFKGQRLSIDEGELNLGRDKFNLDAQLSPYRTAAEVSNAQANMMGARLAQSKWAAEPQVRDIEQRNAMARIAAQKAGDIQGIAEAMNPNGDIDPALFAQSQAGSFKRAVQLRGAEAAATQRARLNAEKELEKLRGQKVDPQTAMLYRQAIGAENRAQAELNAYMGQVVKDYRDLEDPTIQQALRPFQEEVARRRQFRELLEQNNMGPQLQQPAPQMAVQAPTQWQTPRLSPEDQAAYDELQDLLGL